MMPAFIMIGSMIMPATWPGYSSRRRRTLSRLLNEAIFVSANIASGMPVLAGDPIGPVGGADVLGLRA